MRRKNALSGQLNLYDSHILTPFVPANPKIVEQTGDFLLGDYAYEKEEITEKRLGKGICPICGKPSTLIRRTGYLWECEISECKDGNTTHAKILTEKQYSRFSVGDYIRVYERTFEKDAKIILNSYNEGTVTKIYPGIGHYMLDYVLEKQMDFGIETPKDSWVLGKVQKGLVQNQRYITLLRPKEKSYDNRDA